MSEKKVLLELNKLKKYFPMKRGETLKALEDVSLKIYEGEKFGVVGESGCGKSTLGRVILQLYPQTSGACIYYGKTLEEVGPKYLEKEIARLPEYQKKARECYRKSLEVDEKIAVLETKKASLDALGSERETKEQVNVSKRIAELEFQSKELRKDASRQLREGSRTVGSLILCRDLPEIQKLFLRAQQATRRAHGAAETYAKADAAYGEILASGGKGNAELEKKLSAAGNDMIRYRNEARALRAEAFAHRCRNVEMITERCDDPAYLEKLDHNYETGINLGKLTTQEMRNLRRDMQMIFQDPAASLDPRQSVGEAIEEVFRINTDFGQEIRREKTMSLLEQVGLLREHYYSYPHQLSGGQKQRVGIARAIALDPKFIVLDESVSALDVSVQAQILQLLNELLEQQRLTYFFITHNLGVVKHFCDRVLVMYLGTVCELADCQALFHDPLHPYTTSLLAAVPRPAVRPGATEENVLEGEVPSAVNPPKGCPFHTRCGSCMEICRKVRPVLREAAPGHFVACHLYDETVM
ncbi:MAG TPA: ATP-binding cassette domain-containing protein [Oscillospiraceae bacterium]|nr:ATP-binding cassette domain-containing protein [Oscillospiraceae bacterium]